jgi:HK97 family phage portal protein
MSLAELAKYFAAKTSTQTVETPYSKVVAVYACVKRKAQALSMMPLRVSTADDQIVENGPLVELLERPAAGFTFRLAAMAISAFLDLFGRVYIVKQLAGGRIIGWRPVSPLEIAEQRGVSGIIGYTYAPIGRVGVAQDLTLEQVHVITDPDYGTGDLERALSPRHAAGLAISQHYQADVANDQSLRHGAGGGLGLKTDRNLTEPQRDELESTLEDRFSGPSNRHRWMLLEGGLTVEKLFSSFAEMEFTELKYYSREDICVAFGMSPLAMGYTGREGLGSGQPTEKADEIAWTSTHLPRAEWIASELMLALLPAFVGDASLSLRDARQRKMAKRERVQRHRGECKVRAGVHGYQYYFWFDASTVSILQKATLELAKQAAEWIALGVPLNQVISAYDLPFEEPWWGNTWYRPFGLVNVQDEAATLPGATDPDGAADATDEQKPMPDEDAGKSIFEHVAKLTASQLERLWMAWRASWAGLETNGESRWSKHVHQLRQQVLRRLDGVTLALPPSALADVAVRLFDVDPKSGRTRREYVRQMPVHHRDIIAQVLFDLSDADTRWLLRARPLMRTAFELGGKQVMAEHAAATGKTKPDPFSIKDPGVEAAMRAREVRLKEPNKTLRRRLASEMAEGLSQGETTSQIAERLRKEFNLAAGRAKTIARTEIGGAVEDARQQGRKQAGVPNKTWLWSRKETGRPWHFEAERQTMASPIPIDRDFTLPQTGAQTPYPRGPGLDAEDAANCGCTTINRYPNDTIADARGIAHLLQHGFLGAEQTRDIEGTEP